MRLLSWDTIFGIAIGFGLFIYAIDSTTDNSIIFISVSSLAMVVGGTFAATMISFQARYVIKSLKALFVILLPYKANAKSIFGDVGILLEWSKEVKQKGLPILDEKLVELQEDKNSDTFFTYALTMVTSGYKGAELQDLLEEYLENVYSREQVQTNILKNMAAVAPSFGMVGTLVGLIIMLDNLQADAGSLGKGLSLALVTTLYGVVAANLVFKPAALKTDQKNSIERYRNVILTEGFVLLSLKADPIKLQDKMNSFLDSSLHFDILNDGNGEK